jgi:hypothetical protein
MPKDDLLASVGGGPRHPFSPSALKWPDWGEQAFSGKEKRMMQEIRSRRLTPLTAIGQPEGFAPEGFARSPTPHADGPIGVTGLLWKRDAFAASCSTSPRCLFELFVLV